MKQKYLRVLGLMTGTSLDGIDASIIKTNGENVSYLDRNVFQKYNSITKDEIKNLKNKFKTSNQNDFSYISDLITQEHIIAIKNFKIHEYDLIGVHGQTVFHNPKKYLSLQIINAQKISNFFKKRVVYDFRGNDILCGGQGAPIAPIYHKFLIENLKLNLPSCIINIGGISNLTYWDGKSLIGFDCGPGNTLMDKTMQKYLKKDYDKFGVNASKGKVDENYVNMILNDQYFTIKYPKSLDNKYFDKYLYEKYTKRLTFEDLMASLLQITVLSIKKSIYQLESDINSIIITGGGSFNRFLLEKIEENIDIPILKTHLKKKFTESELICYLSARRIYNLPITFPKTTGVKNPTIGGKIINPI